jgi:hypothetical protein
VSDGTPVCSNITVSSRLFPAALPFPVRIGGAVCTNALLDVNGIAYLINRLRPVDDLLHSRHYNSHLASDLPLTSSHFAVAAYWDSLYAIAFASTPASRITVADVTTNGLRYCVIEYRDMRFSYFQTSGFLSFQIVIPADGTNTVCVRYADAAGANTGASATLGAQGPGAAINMPVSYNQPFITDGLTLAYHFGTGGSPLLKDTDGDGLEDGTEVALGTSPANPDTDGDGLADAAEVALGTDPLIWDTDGDGLPDGWEVVNQFDPLDPADGDGDPDGDGLPNRDEFAHGTDPRNRDTDGDGLTDGAEVSIHHTSPLLQDTDSDGLADAAEINIHHTNPLQQDTDTDGMTDGWEVCHGFDPLVNNDTDSIEGNSATDDPDNDGLSNFDEYLNGTNPFNPDTDGDGVSDGAEVAQGSDPKNVSDNGQPPPPEDILELPFHIYGDYAAWEMTIEGQGPSDHRVLKLNTDAPDDSETVTNKLHRGNSYRLTMNWLGSGNYVDPYWHCWEAQVGGLPVRQAYGNPSDYATAVRNPGVAVNLLGAEGWVIDNRDGLLTTHVHSNDNGSGNVAGGLEAILYVPKVEFVTGAASCYNFSPSLGEEAALDVKVTPMPPEGGFPGLHFRLEIVRETADNSEQHIDWVDLDASANFHEMWELDFPRRLFAWDGIPKPGPGASASQAYGRDSFQGESASATRIFPASTLGQPVPPPFVTAVAKIMRNSDKTVVYEARKRVCIPQIVKFLYDADAVSLIKAGLIKPINGVPVTYFQPITDSEWEAMRTSIPAVAQQVINYTNANIRYVSDSTVVLPPYTTVRIANGNSIYLGITDDFSFMNASTNGEAFVYINVLFNNFPIYSEVESGTFALPVTPNEMQFHCVMTAVHECGHMFGLVENNSVLGGIHHHNPQPTGRRLMDAGDTVSCAMMFGRDGSRTWRPLNAAYLQFVFPKE